MYAIHRSYTGLLVIGTSIQLNHGNFINQHYKNSSRWRERARVVIMFDPGFEELQGKLRQIMEEATALAAGIRAWMLLSKEGLPIASAVPRRS